MTWATFKRLPLILAMSPPQHIWQFFSHFVIGLTVDLIWNESKWCGLMWKRTGNQKICLIWSPDIIFQNCVAEGTFSGAEGTGSSCTAEWFMTILKMYKIAQVSLSCDCIHPETSKIWFSLARKSSASSKPVAEGTHFWYRKWFIIDLNFLAWLIIATQKNWLWTLKPTNY